MTYILSALVMMGQAILGLLWLLVVSFAVFIMADALGYVGPVGNEKPSPRWQRRQQKMHRKLWGEAAITKQTLARYIGRGHRDCIKRWKETGSDAWYVRSEEWSIMANDLKDNKIGKD